MDALMGTDIPDRGSPFGLQTHCRFCGDLLKEPPEEIDPVRELFLLGKRWCPSCRIVWTLDDDQLERQQGLVG